MQGIDMHTHSRYSFDSFFEPEDQCEAALQVGLGGLCFTEHFSMDELDVSYDFLEYSQYRQAITNCQQKYKGRLWIGCGLEIGEPHLNKCCQQLDKARQNMDLDFVIGSVHNIGSVTLIDYLKAGRSKDEYYHDYFAEVLQMVQVADIDVVGHLDLAARYGFDEIGDYNFEQYKPVLTIIFPPGKAWAFSSPFKFPLISQFQFLEPVRKTSASERKFSKTLFNLLSITKTCLSFA